MSLKTPFLSLFVLGLFSGVAVAQVAQLDRSRGVEVINLLGSVNSAQQSFHAERQSFADNLGDLGVSFADNPNYSEPIINSKTNLATVVVNAKQEGLNSFSAAITYNNSQYIQIICQSNTPSTSISPPSLNNQQLICPPDSRIVK